LQRLTAAGLAAWETAAAAAALPETAAGNASAPERWAGAVETAPAKKPKVPTTVETVVGTLGF